jgi:gliding motility-associated lipoprotein GldD
MKYIFTIEAVDKRRIKTVKISLPESQSTGSGTLTTLLFIMMFFFVSCGSDPVLPKPKGFMKTNYPEKEYSIVETGCAYSFEIPKYAQLQDKPIQGDTCFKDLLFPYFHAAIHITYKSVSNDSILAKYLEDSHNLAYDHGEKADDIKKTPVFDTVNNVYGIIYDIIGNAASQTQFFLTDSSNHFIRGALYFNHRPNYDSLIPAIDYIHEDIDHMIKTFRWAENIKGNSK